MLFFAVINISLRSWFKDDLEKNWFESEKIINEVKDCIDWNGIILLINMWTKQGKYNEDSAASYKGTEKNKEQNKNENWFVGAFIINLHKNTVNCDSKINFITGIGFIWNFFVDSISKFSIISEKRKLKLLGRVEDEAS